MVAGELLYQVRTITHIQLYRRHSIYQTQEGGFKLPFFSVGGVIVALAVPCALLIRNISKYGVCLVFGNGSLRMPLT